MALDASETAGSGGDRFWRSVGVVLSGAAAAQAIPLLGSLLIARLFSPSEYGVFAVWLGVISLVAIVVTGRYEVALALEPDGELRRIAMVATLATILVGSLGLVLIAASAVPFLASRISRLPLWLLGIPAVSLVAVAQSWQAWAVAEGRYVNLSAIRVAQAAGITSAQILAGTIQATALSLVLGHMAGVLVGLGVATWRLPISCRMPARDGWRQPIQSFWSRHRRFPMYSLPADSVNTAAAQLPLLIVSARFGAEVAGWLAMTMRMLGGPISLLGAAVLDVFRRSAVQAWRVRGECRAEYLQTLRVLATGSAAVALVAAPFSESLFARAFGEPWRAAGTIALWMWPMFALRFVASPLSYIFYVAGKQHVDLLWQLTLLGMSFVTLSMPATYPGALQAYSAGYATLYVLYLVLSYRFSRGAAE